MKEVQRSKEYNSKTGKWEMMSFKENKKGETSVAPAKKKDRIKVEHNYKTGEHKQTNIDAMNRKPRHHGTSDGYMAGAK